MWLEDREEALRRGATILAEIVGFAQTFDAHNMMSIAPDGEQVERMVRTALADADRVIAYQTLEPPLNTTASFAKVTDQLLKQAGWPATSIQLVVISRMKSFWKIQRLTLCI